MKDNKTLIEQIKEDDRVAWEREILILDVTEKICELLEKQNISRQDLANKMEVKEAVMDSWLEDGHLLLAHVPEMFAHLGYKMRIMLVKLPENL